MRTTVAIFLLTAIALAFAHGTVHYVGPSDEAVYLTLARDGGRVYDGAPYVLHPPAYPVAIRALSVVGLDLERAAILLGILASAALVALVHAISRAVSGSEIAALVAAIGLASSRVLAFTAQGAFREPLEVLLLYGVVFVVVTAPEKADRKRLLLGGILAALASLTFDPLGVAAPLYLGVGLLARRRAPGAVAAACGSLAWLVWALYRAHLLGVSDTYPAGIDGMVEDTRPLSLAGFFNPNFLAETARHNAFNWPTQPSFGNLATLVGPSLLARPWIVLDRVPMDAHDALGLAWIGLAVLGLALGARGKGRTLAALALPCVLLGLPGLLGKQARYSMPLVPLVFVLAGLGAARLAGEKRQGARATLVLFALFALVTALARPHLVLAQSWLFRTRSVANVLSSVPAGARIAAYHGWPAELAWLLPGRHVLSLPLKAERIAPFFRDYPPDVLVLPLGEGDPGTQEGRDAVGLSALIDLDGKQNVLPTAGIAVEAEVVTSPALHAYRVISMPGHARPYRFGLHLEDGEALAAALAIEGKTEDPATRDALVANSAALGRSTDPNMRRLLQALESRR